MQNAFITLEFSKVAAQVASFAKTERAKQAFENLAILEKDALEKELSFTQEAIDLYFRYGRLPIDVSSNMESAVIRASKGSVLSIEELDKIAYDIILAEQVRRFMKPVEFLPLLTEYMLNMPSLGFLEKEIHKIIAPDLSIFDNASPLLHSIRVKMQRLEKEMVHKLGFVLEENKDYLSGDSLTMKNGHYVLPVKNAYKNKVGGILQDVSSSGGTAFIEPALIVSLNNQMMELKNAEKEEIHRLLGMLSKEVGNLADDVLLTNRMIGYLDFLQAKALYAEDTKGHVAHITRTKEIYLPRARHPLIDKRKVVPNDFSITEERRAIVISGPNAGGKTVALKTVGIAILMHECGLPILTEQGAEISYVKNVYTDIGDSQSLEDNLSTFSGHMHNLAGIFNSVGGNDLVLLDEIGIGTSPQEGEAIAYASIKYLLDKHCYVMVSSHFEGLKAFALSEKRINNASMIYDVENLNPTYKLKMGLPGESYGLSVAYRYGIDSKVIDIAKSYLHNHEDISVSKAIENLNKLSDDEEKLKERLNRELEVVEREKKRLANDEKMLAERRASYLSDVQSTKEKMLEKAEKEINAILEELHKGEVKPHEAIKAKKKLQELQEGGAIITYPGDVSEGDYAAIPDFEVVGRVTKIKGNNVEIITKDGMSFKTTKDRVMRAEEPPEPKKAVTGAYVDRVVGKGLPLELNMIGMHVDEASDALARYLDACRIKRYKKVRIIHGLGSGALRNMTHAYLKKHTEFVESFELGGQYDGGGGATVVTLK